jgi:futalosine hydrolase
MFKVKHFLKFAVQMTKIILVSATTFEIEPTLRFLAQHHSLKHNTYLLEKLQVTVCVTGVGMVNTAFELGKFKGDDFDLAINAGVAGSFGEFKNGQVLNVTRDCFSELGAEDRESFLSINELGFGEQHLKIDHPYASKTTNGLAEAKGITVNTVHGYGPSIVAVKKRYNCDVESMEGAAFIHAANAFKWKAIQLRAVSNKIEDRNRNNWELPLAINNLNEVLTGILKECAD